MDFRQHFRWLGVKIGHRNITLLRFISYEKNICNKGIQNKLEAWITFLPVDDPEMIVELLERYPRFQPMYEEIYEMCRSTERVMGMFSKELKELDDNTVEFMIDELQEMVDKERARAEEESDRADRAENLANEIQRKYEELLRQSSQQTPVNDKTRAENVTK